MEKTLFTFALAVLFTAAVGQSPCTGSFGSAEDEWRTEWSVSSDYLSITFTVTARTDGWVGIGFSRDQMMPNSDVVVGAISADGRQYFVSDRYTDSQMPPLVDDSQNITDLAAEEQTIDGATYTIITFRRPICSNTEPQDLPLSEDLFLLYSWGPVNNYDANDRNSIAPHVRRGYSEMRINFICNATEGSYYAERNGIRWEAYWVITPDASNANFTVRAETNGWVGIGFSTDRMMANSDVIVGASDGGNNSYVSDRYAVTRSAPLVDDYQDITYESAEQTNENGTNCTTITFIRPTMSTDRQDISLDREEGLYLLFAWGEEINFNQSDMGSIAQHDQSGASMDPINFFRCGVIIVEPDMAPGTAAPTTAAGSAVSVTTTMVFILLLLTLMNIIV